jgi:hypothetical protein
LTGNVSKFSGSCGKVGETASTAYLTQSYAGV